MRWGGIVRAAGTILHFTDVEDLLFLPICQSCHPQVWQWMGRLNKVLCFKLLFSCALTSFAARLKVAGVAACERNHTF